MRRNNSDDRLWTSPSANTRMDQLIGRKHTAQLLSIIGIVCGFLCLITGVCVIFTWAFVPDFSRLYPVGLYAGAVVSALGACFLLLSVVSLCLWQRILKRTATRIRSSLSIQKQEASRKAGNVCQFQLPTCHSIFEEDEYERLGSLKKASSTAYISLGSMQSEKLKLVGVIKGTISTTELDRSIRASTTPRDPICSSSVPTRSATVLFHGDSKPVFTRYTVSSSKQPVMRDKCLRRSLPRVLIQTPNGKGAQAHDSSNSERLAKARSEGLKLDSLNQTSTENDLECNGVNVDVDEENTSPTPVSSADGRVLTRVSTTPPVGQASLFNLNHNTTPNTFGPNTTPTDSVSSPTKLKHSSRSSLDRSGKRYLLMNQSGDVISCTTLFGGEEADDEPPVGPAATTNCRRLQACAGWNFFPVFVQQDPYDDSLRSDDDENRVRHRTTSHSPHPTSLNPSRVRTSSDTSAPMEQQHRQHYFGWFTRIRRFVRERLERGRQTTQAPLPDEVECEGGQTVLLARSSEEITERKRRNVCRAPKTDAKTNTNEMDGLPATDESTRQQGLDEMTGSCSLKGRKQTVISNASVFSLPAIAPELWAAERPVWIMGVPVDDTHWVALDTCDLIFMKEEDRVGSADSVKPVTGSTSSIYAFHVRPPSRLKPARRIPRTRCGRARSLGRILLSEKQSVQPS